MKKENSTRNTIESLAYIEMYVGNIFYCKNFFCTALKFQHIASRKEGETITFLMKQGDIHILITSSLEKDSQVANHVKEYGDSIKKLSFWVGDVKECFENSLKAGAKAVLKPQKKQGIDTATILAFNEVEHEFLQIQVDSKIPGFEYSEKNYNPVPFLQTVDHIALCHPANTISKWVQFYKEAFYFSENKNEDIYSEESGMHIIIMKSPSGKVKLPLVEPSSEFSPLHTYLKYNKGAGVHHVAFEAENIIEAVQHYEKNFGELRKAPPQYYKDLKASYPQLSHPIEKIASYGIMLDQEEKGVLFQIFTKPISTRPTLFLEFVQRDKSEGFGTANIKALYETLEA